MMVSYKLYTICQVVPVGLRYSGCKTLSVSNVRPIIEINKNKNVVLLSHLYWKFKWQIIAQTIHNKHKTISKIIEMRRIQ
jgi:hypothetical protein